MYITEYNSQLFNEKVKDIAEIVTIAQQSTYYQGLKIVIPGTYQQFLNIPITSFDAIEKNEDLLTETPHDCYVFTTGGSTGSPKHIYLKKDELKKNIKYHSFAYESANIASSDTVASIGINGFLTSNFTVNLGLEEIGCFIVPLGIYDDFEKISYYFEFF